MAKQLSFFRFFISAETFARYRVWWHVLFWIWLYALDVFIFGIGYHNITLFLKYALLEMPGQLVFAYAVVYWIIPRHLRTDDYLQTFGLIFVIFLINGIIGHWLFMAFSGYPDGTSWWDVSKILLRGFYCVLKALIFIVIKLMRVWYNSQKRFDDMERTRLQSELKMLKDQVNPHFMFNTLNNLFGLIGRNPIRAQESVLGLSAILRYMLYESNQPTVPLRSELKCISDYIELEKLRYPGNLSVSLNVQDGVEALSIVPLSLFPFVENSFKHGASELINDAWINIDVSVYKHDFVFKIENSKNVVVNQSDVHGIGLKNVKRRLELLYGNSHQLHIVESNLTFLVILKISLHEMNQQNTDLYEDEMSYRGG